MEKEFTAIKLIKRPTTNITPDLFEVVSLPIPELNNGEVLVKQTHMSLDPAMKGWMMPDKQSYIPPVELGEVMRSSGIGQVVDSKNPDLPIGTRIAGMTGWAEYIVSDSKNMRKLPNSISSEAVLCVLALPGLTAYQGLINIGKPKSGETLLVTGAAGSVGSIVGQIAKSEGLNVIGVAGSNDKCEWLKDELGFDAAINYKTDDISAKLHTAAPKGIDLFFENTGGTVQHNVFDLMNPHGRIIVCGMIADYNNLEPALGPNWIPIIKKRLSIQGFTMPDHYDQVPAMTQALTNYLIDGKIKYRVHKLQGLESAIEGINLLFNGGNKGKLLVEL